MPYIPKIERSSLKESARQSAALIETPGQLNFFITRVAAEYLERETTCYLTIGEVIGTLECVKLEFYRRVVSLYEDKKRKENGDVF